MDIQILSDLHLESPKAYDCYEITPTAPHLALLGDIGCVCDPGYLTFLTAQLKQFSIVFHVLGNHEPYGSSWDSVTAKLRTFQKENRLQRAADSSLGEYILLDRDEYHLPEYNITVLGCTLFSHIPTVSLEDVSFGLNDFFRIDSWTVEDHVSAHTRECAWLNSRVSALSRERPDHKIIIFTHHSPTINSRTVNPRTAGNKISSGFATDLGGEVCWTGEKVVFWAFGHTHYNFPHWRDEESGTFVYSNQRGYYFSQAPGFSDTRVIRIGKDGGVVAKEEKSEIAPQPEPDS
ncbi:hypothetical protein INS49_007654 [Diaporthe citri]|uniref:uncharacterized protein n=1 Tax=Diaporthe citri TaxID=83186 RepID=UPI001C7E9CC3|nr:uncharacterized protein INS49_007654 [Diaporthe citri]KAG6362562.1 hypothetical protein INS49_007654 [Diaporthe citri]